MKEKVFRKEHPDLRIIEHATISFSGLESLQEPCGLRFIFVSLYPQLQATCSGQIPECLLAFNFNLDLSYASRRKQYHPDTLPARLPHDRPLDRT